MKITEGRLRLLRAVAATPGLYASGVADLFPRLGYGGRNLGWSAQGATLWGCGYAQPLVNAGLLRKDSHVQCGGARFFITDKGRHEITLTELAALAAPNNAAQTLYIETNITP